MLVHALRGCGMDPGYLVGGAVRSTGFNAGWGAGEWLVVEADESDRSLLKLAPGIAVLTNAELDHHTTYASQRDVDDTFRAFLALADRAAVVWDRPELLALAPPGLPVVPFDADPELTAGGSRFTLDGVTVELSVPGAHNARNAAAALTAARLAGADLAQAAAALRDFQGAGRRFEALGTSAAGARIVDDYAHHPTEVAATLAAARTLAPRRVIAVFQPHLYSRTAHQATEFGAALAAADEIVVLGIYAARERAEDWPGVTGLLVAEAAADAAAGKPVVWMPGIASPPSPTCARACARATSCSRSARATSTRSAGSSSPGRSRRPGGEHPQGWTASHGSHGACSPVWPARSSGSASAASGSATPRSPRSSRSRSPAARARSPSRCATP